MAQSFFGGVFLGDTKKLTRGKAIRQIAPPDEVVIPLAVGPGRLCRPTVAVGDRVYMGQKVGESVEQFPVPVHASVSGRVKAIEMRPCSFGRCGCIVIRNDGKDTLFPEICPPENPSMLPSKELVALVERAGVVGMGGAAFPTYAKLRSGMGRVDKVLVNGSECEGYLTGDYRLMIERPEQVIGGATYLARIFGVDKVIIGVGLDKRDAIQRLEDTIDIKQAPVEVEPLHNRYPQGSEKQICQAITGRQIPDGGLPADVGCAVFNVSTVCAIFHAITEGMPLIRRVVTVSGSGVLEPNNLECPIGTPVSRLLDACGGVKPETRRLILGGPMMGVALTDPGVPVMKNSSGLLAEADKKARRTAESACIRCGRCFDACPMRLEPMAMYRHAKDHMLRELEVDGVMSCIRCGACSYICPAHIRLLPTILDGRDQLRAEQAGRKANRDQFGGGEGES